MFAFMTLKHITLEPLRDLVNWSFYSTVLCLLTSGRKPMIIYNVMYKDIVTDETLSHVWFQPLTLRQSLYHGFPFSTIEYLSLGGKAV